MPIDQRADLYALGMIVSDMLLGVHRRGQGFDAHDDLQRRMTERPVSLRKTNPAIPEAFDQIITRLLEPDPKMRFKTTADLVDALDRLDDKGVPLPLIRRLTPRMIAVAGAIVLALVAGTFYTTRQSATLPVHHDPVSVLIADFQNSTGDAAFTSVLEATLKRGLDAAGFVTAYDRIGLKTAGVAAPQKLDDVTARDVAAKLGFGVVVAGSIAPAGSGYTISMKALQPATGSVMATSDRNAANKTEVLAAAARLAAAVLSGLGDETPESDQLTAMAGLSVPSIDVLKQYVAGLEAASNRQPEDARQKFASAIQADPKFGLPYTSLAASLRELGRPKDAEKYLGESLQHLDGLTAREQFNARGYAAFGTGDYQKCVDEYAGLIKQFPGEVIGREQRAGCLMKLRNVEGAFADLRDVAGLLRGRTVNQLALYADYAGLFPVAEEEAGKLPPSLEEGTLALAWAQVGQDRRADAVTTYGKLRALGPLGDSIASAGLADLAIIEGRFGDATRDLEKSAAGDLAAGNTELAANRYAAIAFAELSRGRQPIAVAAAKKALASGTSVKVRFLAARTLIEAGAEPDARAVINALAAEAQAEPQAHAKILAGDVALKNGNAREAVKLLIAANTQLDTWIGHFDLARAQLAAGAYVQADSEIDRCLKRRGEALSLFLDRDSNFGYFPAAYYYKGLIRDASKIPGSGDAYKRYLEYRGQSKEDPLLADVRKRAGN
jgi:tetratricopeptide (TPR) repeat protein